MATPRDEGEDTLDELLKDKARIEELPDDDDETEDSDHAEPNDSDFEGIPFPGKHLLKRQQRKANLPPWLTEATLGLFHEELQTTSSEALAKTAADCLPYLTLEDNQGLPVNSYGLPHLRHKAHADFLRGWLEPLPAPYVALDASRPWMFYWCIAGLSFLDEDVSQYKERLTETLRPLQNKTGGFGGGHGQLSHCACTYASTLALAAVGGLEMIDRRAMWQWLGTVKQADGGFCMAFGAEEDIRGAYCAMTVITLLNLPLDLPPDAPAREAGLTSFTDRLGEWIGRCQTFEGGIAGAPNNEAHGAYAFCALACLSIIDAPAVSVSKYLDINALVNCLTGLQTTPEGGFQGRSNKLVDACYSHWVGSCFAILEAALAPNSPPTSNNGDEPAVRDLWNREALVRYLLTCGQQAGKKGGMRDKPSTRPDAYHTCYSLSGLSAAQNHYYYDAEGTTVEMKNGRLIAAFNWRAEGATKEELKGLKVDKEDVVDFVHPVFVLRLKAVEAARKSFAAGGL